MGHSSLIVAVAVWPLPEKIKQKSVYRIARNSSALLTPDLDLPATFGPRITTAILCAVQCHNHVTIVVPVPTCPETGSVEGGTTSEAPLDGGSGGEGGEGGNSDSGEEHLGFRYDWKGSQGKLVRYEVNDRENTHKVT